MSQTSSDVPDWWGSFDIVKGVLVAGIVAAVAGAVLLLYGQWILGAVVFSIGLIVISLCILWILCRGTG